jgi:hypothetical protein
MDVREVRAKALIKKQRLGPESQTTMMRRSLDVSGPQGKAKSMKIAVPKVDHQVDHRRQPPLASNDSILTYRQNVAGLWLKYGAKPLKIRGSSLCKILSVDATIC